MVIPVTVSSVMHPTPGPSSEAFIFSLNGKKMKLLITLLLWLYGPQPDLTGRIEPLELPEQRFSPRSEQPRNTLKNPKAHGNHTIIVIDDTHFFPPSNN